MSTMAVVGADGKVGLMATDCSTVFIPQRRESFMRSCCSEAKCFKNFRELEDRIMYAEPVPLFQYVHINNNDVFVTTTPQTNKWIEFVNDVWEWETQKLFEENYVTQLDVNTAGNGKIFAAWRVLDQYRGRYRAKNLTRNVVDIQITIPEYNIVIKEHFCYKYFSRKRGNAYTLVPQLVRSAVAQLYDRYFVNVSLATSSERVHFTCMYCDHEQNEGPDARHVNVIPQWYLDELYRTTQKVSKFNHDHIVLFTVCMSNCSLLFLFMSKM